MPPFRARSFFHPPAVRTLALVVLLGSGAARPSLHAQTLYTWDGSGNNASLGNGSNWQGNVAPTDDGNASVVFTDQYFPPGQGDLAPNLEYNWSFNALTFAGGSSFVLGSTNDRGLNLGAGGLAQNSTAAQTISVPTFLSADQTWTFASGAGALNFTSASASGQIINQGHTLTLSAAGANTLNGALSGTGGLTVNGASTSILTLAGTNTYTGNTTVSAGTLAVTGSVTGGNQAYLMVGLQSSTPTVLSLSGNGSVSVGRVYVGTLSAGSIVQSGGSLTLPTTTPANSTQGMLLMGYYGTVSTYTLGGGTLTTARTQVGDYDRDQSNFVQSGGTHTTGTLALSGFSSSRGTYNLNGGTLNVGAFTVGGTGYSMNGVLGPPSPGTGTFNFNGGTLQASASDHPGAASNPTTFFAGLSAANVRNGGAIIDTNGSSVTVAQGLVHSPLGTLGNAPVLGSSGSGYTSAPTVTVNGGGGYGATAVATINAQGRVTGVTLTSAGTNYTSAPTFTLGGGGGSGAAATDTFTADNATDGGLTKLGPGTLTLTGANTYTGPTTISAGTLQIGRGGTSGSLGTNAGPIANNGTLAFEHSDNLTVANAISGGGGVTQLGGGTLTLSGTNTYTGNTTVSAGTLSIAGSTTSGGTALLEVDGSGTATTLNLGAANSSLSTGLAVIGDAAGGMVTQSAGSLMIGSALYLGDQSGSTGTYRLSGGSLSTGAVGIGFGGKGTFTQSGGTFTTNGNTLFLATNSGSTGTFNLDGGTVTVGGVSGGQGTGTFNFSGGTLQAAANTALMTGVATTNVQTGGAIIDTNGFNVMVASNLLHDTASGAPATDGGLTKLGTGTLTLTGTNTYTGGTTVGAGRLVELNNGNALSTGMVSVARAAVVELSITTATPVSQAANLFTGAGTVQKTGAGTLSFGGNGGTVNVALSAGGVLDVEAGTLRGSSSFQADYTNNLGSLNIAAGATFDGVEGTIRVDALTGAGTLAGGYSYGTAGSTTIGVNNGSGTFTGVIQDSGDTGGTLNLTKVGTGTQALTGASTYAGGTTISGGTLLAANASGSATGRGAVQVNNAGTLAGTGTVAGAVSVASGGTLSPGSSLSPARLTLGNNLLLNVGSTLSIGLGGTAGGTFGQVALNGTLMLVS